MSRFQLPLPEGRTSAAPVPAAAKAFGDRIARLYGATAFSPNLFASPLGPVELSGRELFIPRFINITPRSVEASIRVAVYAGHSHRDLRATEAVLHLVEVLLLTPELGEGLNLTFFPLVDIGGLHGAPASRELRGADWRSSQLPEISTLAREARHRAHQFIVELDTAAPGDGDDLITASIQGLRSEDFGAYADEFLTSADFEPFSVRFEFDETPVSSGPLTLSDDLPHAPVLLRLTFPDNWDVALHREAAALVARSLLHRYRSHQSFGQHI